ncbi:MAG: peptidoglycan-associated lipoprotein Pal [Pseudomonadota bacterium]
MKKLLAVAGIVVLVAGCGTTPGPEQPGAAVEDRGAKPITAPEVKTVTSDQVGEGVLPPELKDPKNILSKRSVYFDFDQFTVKEEFRPLVEAHARFLASHPKLKILIQGNTDERGSREYNLALGQKRADAVRRMMTLLGAREDQIESVSLGEEKPRNPGHDEAAWAENRRADILYVGE